MRFALMAIVGLGSIGSLLTGCAGSTDPAKAAADQQAASNSILREKNDKGALLLVRMVDANLMGDHDCNGHIRLRKIDNGVPAKIAPSVDIYDADRWLLPKAHKPKDLKGSFLFPVANAKSYERSFTQIAPGRYVVTYAHCEYGVAQYGGRTELEAGGDHDGLFSYVSPFGGASTITIGQGQIVDAGYIRLEGTRSDPIVAASEASAAEREIMKEVIPAVYPAITFKKFGE